MHKTGKKSASAPAILPTWPSEEMKNAKELKLKSFVRFKGFYYESGW